MKDLPNEYYRLNILVDSGNVHLKREMEISIQAGEIVGLLYDSLLEQYRDPENEDSLKSLNKLCVRLVFCLYAEDAGLFGRHSMFHDYLRRFEARDLRRAIIDLFKTLETKPEERDPYLDPVLAEFPYVNGGLFAGDDIEIPLFTEEIRELILNKASEDFDWKDISPTIFGAVFESTLNPETRHSGGMHYTSIENIHRVIDPLFLDELKEQFLAIKEVKVAKTRKRKLQEFQDKISKLNFLDPACGSGNFLTETYLSLRRLENEIIKLKIEAEKGTEAGQLIFGQENTDVYPIQVSISQFYGIEINDFAVTVGKTALWIAESQMMKETEDVVHMNLDFLPLESNANIVEGSALTLDWEKVIKKSRLSFIMGNPPFLGYSQQSDDQKVELKCVIVDENGKEYPRSGKVDYVAAWYFKAAQYIQNTRIRVAFVATNSITQGDQVAIIWKPIIGRYGIHIDFAWRTFKWDSESKDKAAVHCVIIGFSCCNLKSNKYLYISKNDPKLCENINPYLEDAPDVFVENRKIPISNVPRMVKGSSPVDGGNFFLRKIVKSN